jgi:hypothetical protein
MPPWGLTPPAPCDKRSRADGFIESDGGQNFRARATYRLFVVQLHARIYSQLPGLAALQRARFSWEGEEHNEFSGIKSCAVKIGEKMLKSAYS